jgi:hypothetical protein
MTALELLKLAWDNRTKVLMLIVVLLAWALWIQQKRIGGLQAQLAAKPMVETKTQTQLVTKVVEGPERIVEKIVTQPGGVQVVERTIYKDAQIATTQSETESATKETPAYAAPAAAPRWIVAAAADPFGASRNVALRAGVTLGGRLDLSYEHSITGAGRQAVDVGWRF